MSVAEGEAILREELLQYFGAINEQKAGLTTKIPPRPEALVLYEQQQVTGLPLFDGGLADQPHLWLRTLRVVTEVVEIFKRLSRLDAERENRSHAAHYRPYAAE